MGKEQSILVKNYSIAPELLEYKLYQVFKPLNTPDQVAVFNDVIQDIGFIVGGNIGRLAKDVAGLIIQAGKEDMMKEVPEKKDDSSSRK